MSGFGPSPRLQPNWDWRAAANFMAGGLGSGLIVWAALGGAVHQAAIALGALAIALGLAAVWAEIGRPWRALNVLRHPQTSWMTREALVAPLVLAGAAASFVGVRGAAAVAALSALAFVYCQARLLQAAKGIPAWRERRIVPLLVLTALAEGGGAWLLMHALVAAAPWWAWAAVGALALGRLAAWSGWRARLRSTSAALAAIDAAGRLLRATTLAALAALVIGLLPPLDGAGLRLLQAASGGLVVAAGLFFKFTLITRAAFTQGFELPHLPVRGVARPQER